MKIEVYETANEFSCYVTEVQGETIQDCLFKLWDHECALGSVLEYFNCEEKDFNKLSKEDLFKYIETYNDSKYDTGFCTNCIKDMDSKEIYYKYDWYEDVLD